MIIIRDIVMFIFLWCLVEKFTQIEIIKNNKCKIFTKIVIGLCAGIQLILFMGAIITIIRLIISGMYNSMFDWLLNFLHIRFSEI